MKLSKRLERMRSNPRAEWSIEDVVALCREHSVMCRPPSGGGSHFRVAHPDVPAKLTIPSRRPIKPIYIRQLVSFIEVVRSAKT